MSDSAPDKIQQLLDDTEQHLADILSSARKQAAAAPSESSIKACTAAEAALREYRDNKTAPDPAQGPAGEWFKNETEAYNYLMSLGYDVSRGKFNMDKNNGLLTVDGKRISKFSVLQYGLRLKQARQTVSSIVTADLQAQRDQDEARKIKAEAEIKEMQSENLKRKLSTEWAHRGEIYTTWAAIMGDLYTAMIHNMSYNTGHIITLIGGDHSKIPHLDEMLTDIINKSFNEVGMVNRIDGCFTAEDMDDEYQDDDDASD